MIDIATLYANKLRNFGTSSTNTKFNSDFLMAFNMVVNDLTTLLAQDIPQATDLTTALNINQQHFNTFQEGLDHYLTSCFEWTHQNKKDSAQFYKKSLNSSHTAMMQERPSYGRLGNHKYPLMQYPRGDQDVFWPPGHSPVDGPIEPCNFG